MQFGAFAVGLLRSILGHSHCAEGKTVWLIHSHCVHIGNRFCAAGHIVERQTGNEVK